jgi:hypothetical protein
MEKYGLSIEELEGQSVELLPDRIEMRRRNRRRRHGGGFDCDNANVNTGVLNAPGANTGANNNDLLLGNNSAAVCFSQ